MSQSERKQIKKIYRLDNCSQISIGLSGPLQLHRQTKTFSTVLSTISYPWGCTSEPVKGYTILLS